MNIEGKIENFKKSHITLTSRNEDEWEKLLHEKFKLKFPNKEFYSSDSDEWLTNETQLYYIDKRIEWDSEDGYFYIKNRDYELELLKKENPKWCRDDCNNLYLDDYCLSINEQNNEMNKIINKFPKLKNSLGITQSCFRDICRCGNRYT